MHWHHPFHNDYKGVWLRNLSNEGMIMLNFFDSKRPDSYLPGLLSEYGFGILLFCILYVFFLIFCIMFCCIFYSRRQWAKALTNAMRVVIPVRSKEPHFACFGKLIPRQLAAGYLISSYFFFCTMPLATDHCLLLFCKKSGIFRVFSSTELRISTGL